MIRVKNRSFIAGLSRKSLTANRSRNLVAVAAIALTTLLFTTLFTIALSINAGIQQSNFRQVGGYSHGTFKYLTKAQFHDLRTDPQIKEWGLRRVLGVLEDPPFNKDHVEVGYSDATNAHWMYCDPVVGGLPEENSNQAATDTRVLELLGIRPELGAEFTVTFPVDGKETTQTFTLCGWWEFDQACSASHILVPESRVDAILTQLNIDPDNNDSRTGCYGMDVMFSSSWQIEQRMNGILSGHGYQSESRSQGDNYISIGVNWGYTGSQLSHSMDPTILFAGISLLVLIVLTGYLIIYNVFQISVMNDIRFYGMLKTVGTTPRQLRRIIRNQALTLSFVGIPIGLLLGWCAGSLLVPMLVKRLDSVVSVVSANPLIFVISTLLALGTVLLSCARPGWIAGAVSPIEALRYTEGSSISGSKTGAAVSIPRMAWANLGRSRIKTIVTVLSLSLAVLLLNLTVTFSSGFDMDKYLSGVVSDFILADAKYFQTGSLFSQESALSQEAIDVVNRQDGITAAGRVYGGGGLVYSTVTEEYYRSRRSRWANGEMLDQLVAGARRTDDGLLKDSIMLYGMESYPLDKLTVLEGDLSDLHTPGSRSVAAVYHLNDYGDPMLDTNWAKLGDTVTLEYVDEYKYVPIDPDGDLSDPVQDVELVILKSHMESYTVTALVAVPTALSYRYYSDTEFVLNDQTFVANSSSPHVMLYAFDTDETATTRVDDFLQGYTTNQNPSCDYESKEMYMAEFEDLRSMFIILGGSLSFIVGLVGILNFFNAVLTGILTRRRELAMLQSIGMTGRQLKAMLIYEGLFYALGSIALSLILTVVAGPLLSSAMEGMFWFYSYHFTVVPIAALLPVFAALGVALPLASYRVIARQSIVERLRHSE